MTSKKQSYFKILGIQPTSDKAVIKKAYRKKAFQYHPDRNKLPGAHGKFIRLTEAYEALVEVPKETRTGSTKQRYAQKTSEEVMAERMRAARERYQQAQKKEAEEDLVFYNKLTGAKFGNAFKWFGYASLLASAIWFFDYLLAPNVVHVNLAEYLWTGPEICFDIRGVNYCFDSRQAAGLGKHWEAEAHFSPILGDLKYIITKDYVGDFYKIYAYRTFSSSFPVVPFLMIFPFLTWRFRQPAPWFVFLYFVSWVLVGGMLLFRVFSLIF